MTTGIPTAGSPEARLKRTITLPQALGITFHQIVGAGILAIMGSAIGMTGGGVGWAILITAIALPLVSLPYAGLASAMPTSGGMYRYAARILHPLVGYANLSFVVLSQITVGVVGLTAGVYLHSLNPIFDARVVAAVLILLFFVINILGASFSARIGIILALIMFAAYAVFIVAGFAHVKWDAFPQPLPNGVGGLLMAAALMTFVLGGGTFVAELGGEMKNPGRTIPISIVGGTVLAGVIYILLAVPAVGVLPVAEVAGKPLSVVAQAVLPQPLFVFFILGGSLVASFGTMNASMTWGTKALLVAIDDGWFPRRFGAVNRRFGTPHWLLITVTAVGLAPVVLGYGIEDIASGVAAFLAIAIGIVIWSSVRLRARRPDVFSRATFRMPWPVHIALAILAVPVLGTTAVLLIAHMSRTAEIGIGVWVLASAVWCAIRYPRIRAHVRARQRALLTPDAAAPAGVPVRID